MKKSLIAIIAAASLATTGCTSVESATVAGSEITATGGEAISVIQANTMGFSLFLYFVTVVNADLDNCINKVLVSEAKAMGATKIDLKSASTTPTHGIWSLTGLLVAFPNSQAVGIAVK